jgi:hypothetical protein
MTPVPAMAIMAVLVFVVSSSSNGCNGGSFFQFRVPVMTPVPAMAAINGF